MPWPRKKHSQTNPPPPFSQPRTLSPRIPPRPPPPIGTTGTMSTRMGSRTVIKVSFVAGKIEEGLSSFEKSGLAIVLR